MIADSGVVNAAKLIGDETRTSMLLALLDDRALPASELARQAGVSPQTASNHLAKLVKGKLLKVESHGRHRYYQLAGPDVAGVLEALSALSSLPTPSEVATLTPIQAARTCYDHLAGKLGVTLAETLTGRGFITPSGPDYVVTDRGREGLARFGIDFHRLHKQRRHFARQCLDWTERRPHVAGALGAALLSRLLELKWVVRVNGERVVHVTSEGVEGLYRHFALKL